MAGVVLGRIGWGRTTNQDGHRDYRLKLLVQVGSPDDGPAIVSAASGMPLIGAPWTFGSDNDPWAFCIPSMTIIPVIEREPNLYWTVEQTFTTRPMYRCQTTAIDSPLDEPARVSGSFVRYQKGDHGAVVDRFGDAIKSSSHEPITGIQKDANRASVIIEQNVLDLDLDVFTDMVDTVNDATLWGLPARCIKLGLPRWERKLYGSCSFYYTRVFEFEIRFDTFDEYDIVDVGYKVLDPTWAGANPAVPGDFILATDRRGHRGPARIYLNGAGLQSSTEFILPTRELYDESNFMLLDIPSSL